MVDQEALEELLENLRDELRELEREAMRDLVLPVELLDGRAVIRRTKAFEATTGPPPDTPRNEMPRLGWHQAGQISQRQDRQPLKTVNPDATRHRSDFHSEISERDRFVLGLVDATDSRDLTFASKIIDLWALGPRALCQFLLELSCRRLLRSEVEQLVDVYLGGKST